MVEEGGGLPVSLTREIMESDWTVSATKRSGDMRHPDRVWVETSYADESIEKLRGYYLEHLKGRASPASPATIDKYGTTLLSFIRSLGAHNDPVALASLTPHNVNRWVSSQRQAGQSEDGIAS